MENFRTVEVFPAHAGVSPRGTPARTGPGCFPRTRGGEPNIYQTPYDRAAFSPHTRG